MEHSKTITILNDLLHIINDRLEGFEKVKGKVWETNRELKEKYEHIISHTRIMKVEIINLITARGGNPQDSASVTGTLHRVWVDIKNAFVISDLESSTLQNVILERMPRFKPIKKLWTPMI